MEQLIVKSLETIEDEKNVYIEGYASAAVKDLDDEIITEEALKAVADEITKEPYNKVFFAHAPLSTLSEFEEKIPIGKIVEAAVREIEGKTKLWIKLMMNKAHPHFKAIYDSVKSGFLNAFSIGFRVLSRQGNRITGIKILEVSLVPIPANPEAVVEEVYEKMFAVKGVIPRHTFKYGKDEESPWKKPALSDFTDEPWEELSEDEQRFIAAHFAYTPKNPPDRYTDLKFSHHNPTKHPKPHAVNLRGVIAGFVRLSVTNLPEEDKLGIYRHLAAHYKDDFGREPPDYKSLIDVGAILKEAFRLDEEAEEAENQQSDLKSLDLTKTSMEEVERVKELEKATAEMTEKIRELEAKLAELEAENERLKAENEKLATEIREYEERERAALIGKIRALTDEVNEEELAEKGVAELKEIYLAALESKILKAKSLPPKVKVGGEDSDEVSFKGVF